MFFLIKHDIWACGLNCNDFRNRKIHSKKSVPTLVENLDVIQLFTLSRGQEKDMFWREERTEKEIH